MLNSAQQILVVGRMWIQIIEIGDLISMFKVMLTVLFFMVCYDDKFLTFMFGKFTLQL